MSHHPRRPSSPMAQFTVTDRRRYRDSRWMRRTANSGRWGGNHKARRRTVRARRVGRCEHPGGMPAPMASQPQAIGPSTHHHHKTRTDGGEHQAVHATHARPSAPTSPGRPPRERPPTPRSRPDSGHWTAARTDTRGSRAGSARQGPANASRRPLGTDISIAKISQPGRPEPPWGVRVRSRARGKEGRRLSRLEGAGSRVQSDGEVGAPLWVAEQGWTLPACGLVAAAPSARLAQTRQALRGVASRRHCGGCLGHQRTAAKVGQTGARTAHGKGANQLGVWARAQDDRSDGLAPLTTTGTRVQDASRREGRRGRRGVGMVRVPVSAAACNARLEPPWVPAGPESANWRATGASVHHVTDEMDNLREPGRRSAHGTRGRSLRWPR
ncbi:hypothetical protein WOLCODRAFT_163382 [Wolfiporia cocos MD-104 SS10]|uniref:Uncharacterized protein n=1 Tax=Wolfiporia cocos (strain MD-104) TaxID=742152 RepID=A0A2H3JYI3_WOLCO|nr:hypothetical protein WOLCODRAFT_163382 [Wolfiporia cocos MD-104 SS10]